MRNLRKFAVAAAGACGALSLAADFDLSGLAGRVYDIQTSTVVNGGGAAQPVRRWVPFVFDEVSSLFNNSVVEIVSGRILGGATSFSSTGNPRLVFAFGTADKWDGTGYTSNDVMVAELANQSNTIGDILPDGRIVYRANFAGLAQNNIEVVQAAPGLQTPFPPDFGPGIFSDGTTSTNSFLGTPGALPVTGVANDLWVGMSNFSGVTPPTVPLAVNIWHSPPATRLLSAPDYIYSQSAAEGIFGVPAGNGRQTQPDFARVSGVDYVIFGFNNTSLGGSARPAWMIVDAFQDNDAYTGAAVITAPAGYLFMDHQATGGGANPFQNKRFGINDSGQVAVAVESTTTPRTYQVLRYDPVFNLAGRIVSYTGPTLIADCGAVDAVAEGVILNGTFLGFSGVGINNLGNIAFTANYNASGTPRTAIYFWESATSTLHQISRELDTLTTVAGSITVGLFPQDQSDAFFSSGLARNANVLAVLFRDQRPVVDFRGVLVLAVGGLGDVDFDGRVGPADLGSLLGAWNTTIGVDAAYDPQIDFDMDGFIGPADLGSMLGNWNP